MIDYSKVLSQTVVNTPKSGIRKFFDIVSEMPDAISLGVGEPDFDTPKHIKDAAIAAIMDGKTKYTPASGTLELRQAICDKFQKDNGLTYTPNEIVVSSGAKSSLYHAICSIVEEGDEVIIPSPYWLTYPELVKLAGGIITKKLFVLAEGDAKDRPDVEYLATIPLL